MNKENQKNGTLTKQLYQSQAGFSYRREQFVPFGKKQSFKNFLKQKYYEIFDQTQTLTYRIQQLQLNKVQEHKNKNILMKEDETYYLENIYNTYYYLSVYIGSQQQEIELLLNTQSSYFLLLSQECQCTTTTEFNQNISTTFEIEDNSQYSLEYSRIDFEVYFASDDIYIDSQQQSGVKSFEFLIAIDTTSKNDENDDSGFIGFCRNIKSKLNDGSYYQLETTYYYALYYEGIINSPSFALSLNEEHVYSYITFGGADFDRFANIECGIIDIPLQETFQWSALCEGFKIGSDQFTFKYEDDYPIIFSSANLFTYLPYSIGEDIIDLLLEDINYELYDDLIHLECSEGYKYLKSIFFLIDEHYYEMPVEAMLYDIDYGVCVLLLTQSRYEEFKLGTSFMMNYYIYFNNLKDVITIAPSKFGYVDKILTKDGKEICVPDNDDSQIMKILNDSIDIIIEDNQDVKHFSRYIVEDKSQYIADNNSYQVELNMLVLLCYIIFISNI